MSGIAGWVGTAKDGAADALGAMLAAIDYRGDTNLEDRGTLHGLGYRFWKGRPGKSPAIEKDGTRRVACAGTFAPPVASPALDLLERTRGKTSAADVARALGDVDGAFAFAIVDEATGDLVLGRDPFGVRSLYWVEHEGRIHFASELKQLLAIPKLPVEIDASAIHKYLTFSFVPGEAVPVRGVKRLLPGHVMVVRGGKVETAPYFTLQESIQTIELRDAVRQVRKLTRAAIERRLNGEPEVGLFLSGGLDSSAVGFWLKKAGANVRALTLDFGKRSVEREQAEEVAKALELPLEMVSVGTKDVARVFHDVVHRLDLPFGDAVTAPQYLLGEAAKKAGLIAVFNGEGGDQLFGGWTSKPMIAAAMYGDLYEHQEETDEERYLASYHRFYGLEDELYTEDFKAQVGGPGQRRAHLAPYLGDAAAGTFLNRVRLADISLKGSQNILPRAERMSNAWGLDVRVPLFDRQLAEASFHLPPDLKLNGACEKYVFKLAMKNRLPEDIVWRKKFGMSVPVTDFVLAPPLSEIFDDLLGEKSLKARGWFRPELVRSLREGRDVPGETRKRRIGERLWALAMLEAWMRVVDKRGTVVAR